MQSYQDPCATARRTTELPYTEAPTTPFHTQMSLSPMALQSTAFRLVANQELSWSLVVMTRR